MTSIKEYQIEITKYAIEHGFTWTPNDINTMILRIISELTEASEAVRDNDKENLAEELADTFIRLANTCEVMGIDLEQEVIKKHKKNLLRPHLHGRGNK